MPTVHAWNGYLLIGVCVAAGVWALVARWRPFGGGALQNCIAFAQTLIAAQLGIGLLLLAGGERVEDGMHYTYGVLALVVILAPFMYAPSDPRARLAWFGIACLLAATLAVRAYMTA
jgi:hypothetical protein